MIRKYTVSRDDSVYEAWPDVALAEPERLVCVFSQTLHHNDRSRTCIMVTSSDDRGRTWSAGRPLTSVLRQETPEDPYWNCARIAALSDGRLVVSCDRIAGRDEGGVGGEQSNWLWFSRDRGETWDGPYPIPVVGIVPDRLIELRRPPHGGRWILSAHTKLPGEDGPVWQERCWLSDDAGATWSGPTTIACDPGLQLCEGSVLELPGGELVCFMRENSGRGLDALKCVSRDGGETWSAPVPFPLPGCHRPSAGLLRSGRVLVTHRFMQGGRGWLGWWTQNLFAGLTDVESCLATSRAGAHARILPIDFDRHPESDTGYSGWVQLADGEIHVVNYILDDAPKAQIRGYALREEDFILPS